MKCIPVGHGRYATVDDQDYEFLLQWKWHSRKKQHSDGTFSLYAVSNQYLGRGLYQQFVMHHLVAELAGLKGAVIDHRNRHTLNNRRPNLRVATPQQSNANRRGWAKSGHKGVTQLPSGRWRARIKVNGLDENLGTFDTVKQAKSAYKRAAKKYFGEFAAA